jgi:hypothetical protein
MGSSPHLRLLDGWPTATVRAVKAGRIALVALVLLGLVAVVTAGSRDDGPAVPGAVKGPGPGAPEVRGELPADRVVEVRAGDVVRLLVRSDEADVAEVPRLGLRWPVGPRVNGELVFVAPGEGRYGVRLRRQERRAGTLAVAAR